MDEQPKPVLRRTATRNTAAATTTTAMATTTTTDARASATKPARASRASAKAPARTAAKTPTRADAKAPTKSAAKSGTQTPPKRTAAAAARPLSTSDTGSMVEPGGRHSKVSTPAGIRDLIARLGPDARDWVTRIRERYPSADAAAVARLAASVKQRPEWLVLAVAAAYGVDPTDPARAEDLHELQVHSGRSGLEARARARYSQET